MSTTVNLRQEYTVLKATYDKLIEERATLRSADGPTVQDHQHRMRRYLSALDAYQMALDDRRKLRAV